MQEQTSVQPRQDRNRPHTLKMSDQSKSCEHLLRTVSILQQLPKHWLASRASGPFAQVAACALEKYSLDALDGRSYGLKLGALACC